ncbi:MAG: hydrolase [Dorea sp.]|jgi:peptidoglycan hydrolase CwlO-like protein|nr:hydrolase [Dorea sp.]
MKRFGTRILTAVMAGSLIVMPVSAAPTVDQLKKSKESAQGEVNSLKAELTKIVGKIDKLERDLIKTGQEIDTVTVELGDAKKLEKQQYEDMKLRIRYMYEQGDASALEALVNAKDFSDLMNKAEYVQKVHAYDREKLNEYIETKTKVSKLKTKLEKEKKEMEGLQTEYETQEDDLNEMIVSKRAEVADLDVQLQEAVAEAARRAEEEERARREEEERKAAEKASKDGESAGTQEDSSSNGNSNGNNSTSGGGTSNNDGASDSSGNAGDNKGSSSNDADNNKGSSNDNDTSSNSGGGAAAASAIVSAAYGQLGVPYVYSGASPSGFDCSGLVMYCHRAAGISLAHSSGSQGSGGKSVSSPQAGDVVCYAGHVGIYIGGGKMIHAPQTGDVVKISSVSSVRGGAAWYRRYW